ncbi:MAG: hypothetical protein GEEBNDBF_01579 [bacterium]|nr:hypothetical protein [bacterium]
MSMDPRQRQKEILRMKREIELIQASIEKNSQAAGQKQSENKQLEDAIRGQEAENDKLGGRVEELEGQIVELDEEFRDNQMTATRLRREIKAEENNLKILVYIGTGKRDRDIFDSIIEELPADSPYRGAVKQENLETRQARLKNHLADLENHLKDLRRNCNDLELKLRRSEAKIEEIQKHPMSKPVTAKIEKQQRLDRQEREAKGIKERTMAERLHELEGIRILSSAEYLQQLVEKEGTGPLGAVSGQSGQSVAAAPEEAPATAPAASANADAGGSGLDLSF